MIAQFDVPITSIEAIDQVPERQKLTSEDSLSLKVGNTVIVEILGICCN